MARTGMIGIITRKEVTEMVRDGRLRLLSVFVGCLAITALVFGLQQALKEQHEREEAQARAAAQWEGQGEKNPHVAAHYGTHVFAPAAMTTAIDPGVSNFLGRSIKIEAHKRNLSAHSRAQDSGANNQLGAFSVATILLSLMPLLIIALGYGAWGRERERGTLRQLLSTSVRRRDLFWGKLTGLGIVIAGLLIPAALILVGALWWVSGGDSDVIIRLTMLLLSYFVYFSIFGALTLFVSAILRTSQGALVAMIGLWGLFCLIIPRVAAEVSAASQPLISKAEFARRVAGSLKKGIDGKTDREVTIEATMKDLLAQEGFADAGFMLDPAVARGAELRAEAHWEDQIFDHHVNALNDSIQRQEAMTTSFGLLSPFMAMRALSTALCGTDFDHHRHFSDYAESWRKSFVEVLNKEFAEKSGRSGWRYKAGPDLWKKAPPFQYERPDVWHVLHQHRWTLVTLFLWLLAALGLASWSAPRVKVVG